MSVRKKRYRVQLWARYYSRYTRVSAVAPLGFDRAWAAWLKEARRVAEERDRKEMPPWSRLPAESYE